MKALHAKWWLIALLAIVAIAAPAHAQTFPSKTIRIIVPYPPGGSIDLTARVIAKNLQDSVGQSVVVENKPGGNAAIGIEALLRSDPDGHTLAILSDSPVTINVHLARLNYDPLTDLVPISRAVSSPIILAANAKAGIASIADLIAAAKTKPLSYAVAARGSVSHLAAELLQRELGITMQAVPYRGGAPAAVAIASGEVPLGLFDTAAILPMISLFAAGILLGTAYAITGNLWLPIALHFGWNFLQGPVLGETVSGRANDAGWRLFHLTGPPLMTGGKFGVEGGLIAIIITILGTPIVLLAFRRRIQTNTPTT